MKNHKVIVITGFQRGGTNILWNILQSHPLVCSSNFETGEIISQSYRFYSNNTISFVIRRFKSGLYGLLNKKSILNSSIVYSIGKGIDFLFYKYKIKTYKQPYNRFKFENELYNKKEIKNSVLCLKSVKRDVKLTNFLSRVYKNIFFIGLVRNGYALCESWIRRGKNAKECGIRYRDFCETMINDSKKIKNYSIVKFEDIMENPFNEASKLYEFTQLKPTSPEKLRFKVKKVLTGSGEHKIKYGKENAKYWFNRENVRDLLDPNINKIQLQKLSENDKKTFKKEAKDILDYFNYSD